MSADLTIMLSPDEAVREALTSGLCSVIWWFLTVRIISFMKHSSLIRLIALSNDGRGHGVV